MSFPKKFAWGAATASYQIEGGAYEDGKGLSVWDIFSRQPGKTWGQTGDVTSDHYHHYKEDVRLMGEVGLNAYRLSVSWPRVIPNGTGKINAKGLAFYDRLIDLLLDELVAAPSLPLRLPWPVDPEITLVCRQLADHPDNNATLKTWATQLGVDAKTVQRRFVRETGMTFGRWRQQARLVHALERLASGERVLDVALDLGYNSPSAFSSMFKRQFGATPSAYFA